MPRSSSTSRHGAQSGLAQQTSVQISQHELLSLSSRAKRGQQQCLISQESDVESSGERNLPQKRKRRTTPLVSNQHSAHAQYNTSPQVCASQFGSNGFSYQIDTHTVVVVTETTLLI